MVQLLSPLPLLTAKTRLKSNLFLLILLTAGRLAFPPYLALRRGLGKLELGSVISGIETIISFILAYNILEATWSIYLPPSPSTLQQAPALATPNALKIVPIMKSSPLTRAYPTPTQSSHPNPNPNPNTNNQLTPLARRSNINPSPSSSNTIAQQTTPASALSKPLSASTSTPSRRLLNPSTPTTTNNPQTSQTGLFYDPNSSASPSKVGQSSSSSGGNQTQGNIGVSSQSQSQSQVQGSGSGNGAGNGGAGGEFVLVNREDKEWAENVWKGVRGKRGRISLG